MHDVKTGRTGLRDIDVTPLVYLQLRQLQKDGHEVTYNQSQLAIALRNHMRKNEGDWPQASIKDDDALEEFAEDYVMKKRFELAELQNKPGPKSRKTLQLEKFLQEQGVPIPNGLPKKLQVEALTSKDKIERNIRYAEKGVGMAMLVDEGLDAATTAEPTAAVAAVLAVNALMPTSTTVSNKSSEVLFGTYESRAESRHERDICVKGLTSVMDESDKRAHTETIDRLQAKETDADSLIALENLRHDSKAAPLETALENQKIVNETLTVLQEEPKATIPDPVSKKNDFMNNGNDLTASLAKQALKNPELNNPYANNPFYIDPKLKPPAPNMRVKKLVENVDSD